MKKTLERLVDFDRINDLKCRLSVGAVGITSGNFRYFDNVEFKRQGKLIGPEHIMASGALPPGFPAVLIDGEYYWDGGIASNTPLDYVLDAETDRDLLIFQVDLFSARGLLPETLLEAAEREKDIRYSSRTRMNTDKNRQIHNARKAVRDLIGKLPEHLQHDPSVEYPAQGGEGEHGHGRAPDLQEQELRDQFQGLRFLPCRHGRALECRRARRAFVDASQGMAGTAAVRRNHGDLRSHGGRRRDPTPISRSEDDMGTLTGKNAVVTGSTSGIGLAYARAFAKEGANVVINGFGAPADIEKERSAIETDYKVKAIYSSADMTKPAEIADMIATGEKTFGSVDILVNNAGIQFVSPIEEFPVEKWDAIIAINLSSAFHGIRAAVPGMKKRGWGRIINTASAHSLVASPFKSAYVSAKHGIAGLTKTVALEVAQHKITCNCISPGYVWTPLVEHQIPDTMKARNMTKEQVIKDVLLAAQPTKEFVTSEQVAALALFLCGDDAAQITGANLSIDGGWTAE